MPGEKIAAGPWQGAAAGEDGAKYIALLSDPIAALVERLELAAIACGPLTLGARASILVRRVSGGYVVLRAPGW
jgi:hypothetical protein